MTHSSRFCEAVGLLGHMYVKRYSTWHIPSMSIECLPHPGTGLIIYSLVKGNSLPSQSVWLRGQVGNSALKRWKLSWYRSSGCFRSHQCRPWDVPDRELHCGPQASQSRTIWVLVSKVASQSFWISIREVMNMRIRSKTIPHISPAHTDNRDHGLEMVFWSWQHLLIIKAW